ncbi:hypothetical protein C8E83_2526 [Frondihabitans australicus]|uniref:Uncharacterized protein n=2 Tax=Frondihabitans australicus TaxID=386892 RepID=A0A495II53_9MICO|nr:hypothetical protein C8E83_2526 [Frondihabitans australicus]
MGADGSQAAPRDDEPGVFADASLVAFAPTRWIQVAGSAALLVAIGLAAIVFTPTVVKVDREYLRAVIPALGACAVVLGIVWLVFGLRAYRTFAEHDVARFTQMQLVGLWIMTTLFVATGIAGGVWGLVVFGSGQVSVFTITFSRPPTSDRGSTIARLRRRLRPCFMGEAAVMLAAAVALGVVSLFVPLPRHLAADYQTNAIVLLFFSIVGAVWLVVRRRRGAQSA